MGIDSVRIIAVFEPFCDGLAKSLFWVRCRAIRRGRDRNGGRGGRGKRRSGP